jgi:methyl-accepting chemotaxis protein
MTQEIVDAVADHAAQSRTTTAVITRLNETVTRIVAVTQEQANGCAAILNASEQMREQTTLVRRAILEQKQGSRRISESVGRVTHVGREIGLAGEEQRQLSCGVVDAMERIGGLSHEHVSSLVEIHDGVRTLTEGAEELRKQVSLFGDDQGPAGETPELNGAELLEYAG